MKLSWKNFCFDFSEKTYIMGILNVTRDSFSDGGLYFDKSSAVQRAIQMVEEGADIIDIGGESTRPGSEPVCAEEELKRTIPVIEALAKNIGVPISIDTYKSEVAKKALDAGASMVNDISGLRFDPEMANVVSQYKIHIVGFDEMGNKCLPDDYMERYLFLDDVGKVGVSNDIAFFLEQTGYYDEAIWLLNRIVSSYPERTVAYLNLGDAYWGKGNKNEAKNAYRKYVELMKSSGKERRIPKQVTTRMAQ